MSSLRLLVGYDGSAFSGFQIQPDRRTVQGELMAALRDIADGEVVLRGAGRTDAGVHALGQVVSVDGVDRSPDEAFGVLGARLPSDISVLDVQDAVPGFDARHSATWRAYTYLLWCDEARHPLFHRFMHHVRVPVDVDALREALRVTEGTHDFRSFARVREDQSPQRTVLEAAAVRDGPLVRISIVAVSFLHQMVRSVTGSALEVATGRRPLTWMKEALLARDRAAAGPVAPPGGLTLADVGYPDAPWPRRGPLTWPWSDTVYDGRQVVGGMWCR